MGRLRGLQKAAADGSAAGPPAGRLAGLFEAVEKPGIHAALLALLILVGLFARFAHVDDPSHYFTNHADEATYFNQAYDVYLAGGKAPLAHSGSGLPLFLEQVFRSVGIPAGTEAAQQLKSGPYSNATVEAARVAYFVDGVLAAALVPAVYWLAVGMVRPAKALLATALVAFDPFLLFLSGDLMSEQMFALAVVLAFGCAVRARSHPGWLVPGGAVLAFAAMARGNGVFLVFAFAAFAWLVLRPTGQKGWVKWTVAGAAAFAVVAFPYLQWRGEALPGPFDYGTNTRMFTDNYWNFSDHYWKTYSYAAGGEKETLSDYFGTHTFAQALDRLYMSVQWPIQDLFGGAVGHRPHPEGVVLEPFLAIPLVAALLFVRKREFAFFLAVAVATMAPFVWSYHLHDSPRYLIPLTVLAPPLAVEGAWWLAQRTPWPGRMMAGFVGAFLALFAVHPVADALGALRVSNPSWGWTLAIMLPTSAMALAAAVLRTRQPTPAAGPATE